MDGAVLVVVAGVVVEDPGAAGVIVDDVVVGVVGVGVGGVGVEP
ncbi:MAG: hypothetical protein ACXV0U_05165 [Kineosporiaceae bacterium]